MKINLFDNNNSKYTIADAIVVTTFLSELSMGLSDGYGENSGRHMAFWALLDFEDELFSYDVDLMDVDSLVNNRIPYIEVSDDPSYEDEYDTFNDPEDYISEAVKEEYDRFWDDDENDYIETLITESAPAIIKNKFLNMTEVDIIEYIKDTVKYEYDYYTDYVIDEFDRNNYTSANIKSVEDVIEYLCTFIENKKVVRVNTKNDTKILIKYAKRIAEHCNKHEECNEKCAFYIGSGDHVCLFNTNSVPCRWDFNTIEKS